MQLLKKFFGSRQPAPVHQLALVPSRKSLVVRLYVDCSTSMTSYAPKVPSAINKMLRELRELAQQLQIDLNDVLVSMVAFNGQRVEVQPFTPIDSLRSWSITDYAQHRANGSKVRDTIVGGIRSVREQATRIARQDREVMPAVVVISDGHDFGSVHSIAETSGIVSQARADGINVFLNYLGVDAQAAQNEAAEMGLDVGHTMVAPKEVGALDESLTQSVWALKGARTFIGEG